MGFKGNLFHQGVAKEVDDPEVVGTTRQKRHYPRGRIDPEATVRVYSISVRALRSDRTAASRSPHVALNPDMNHIRRDLKHFACLMNPLVLALGDQSIRFLR